MGKETALIVIDLLILLIGVVTIILAIKNPMKLLKVKEDKLKIDDKAGFIKKIKTLYVIFGLICIVIPTLSIFKLIPNIIVTIFIVLAVVISNIINTIMLEKIIKK